jgi:signal transduction histidine kinase
VRVCTDQTYLSRILDNLITNAIKFSEQGSSVYIDVQSGEDKATIQIRDEGPGFREEDLPHLFKKFKKLSARPTNGESSTGLGLAIVKLLVEKLNGMIRVESQSGRGACFVIELPLSEENVLMEN